MDADMIVVGAGAIGTSVAYHVARTGHRVLVVEKEGGPALHQSGRNSGVIHAGFNLKPGTAKARYCSEGNRRLRDYCRSRGVAVEDGGILVLARTEAERRVLSELKQRADANGTRARLVGPTEIQEIEPHATGLEALHAPEGASLDAHGYVDALAADARSHGAIFRFGTRVLSISETPGAAVVDTDHGRLTARALVNCSGLQVDRLAGPQAKGLRIIPFRGFYAEVVPARRTLVRSHVYAAPDLAFPFLGVHLSRRTDGRLIVGPGAMLAFGREVYRLRQFDAHDLASTLTWPGFWKLFLGRPFRRLVRREVAKSLFLDSIWAEARRLVPDLRADDLERSYAGNRAQLVTRDGALVEDILVTETRRLIHVLNAVSPGLTCSLPFGEHLAGRAVALL